MYEENRRCILKGAQWGGWGGPEWSRAVEKYVYDLELTMNQNLQGEVPALWAYELEEFLGAVSKEVDLKLRIFVFQCLYYNSC